MLYKFEAVEMAIMFALKPAAEHNCRGQLRRPGNNVKRNQILKHSQIRSSRGRMCAPDRSLDLTRGFQDTGTSGDRTH